MGSKIDPIRDEYFAPLEAAEKWSEHLFYATALTSVVVPLIDSTEYPTLYAIAQIAFGIFAIAGVILGLTTRFYWAPRGAEKRFSDFVSTAFAVNLTPERTQGYYNNAETDPIRKAALQLLENALFTKEIARIMCRRRRIVVGIYLVLWIAAMFNRNTPMDFVVVGCQVLFSEELISSIVRLEWLRARTERTFDALFRHLSTPSTAPTAFMASVVELLVRYEYQKAVSNVTLSSGTFEANNSRLSAEWNRLRATLGA